ncbi:MAG TPA: PPC domain-containing DNA-binding protein [Polyangiaceae bacterium]|jgi:hypothetical protein|nr:PPC domain-containing DNA-binding protein [Polyangiaceae bacterium]
MKTTKLDGAVGARTFAVVLAKGDDPAQLIAKMAKEQRLGTSRLTAIGGFSKAVLGYFDRTRRDYIRIPIEEQAEVLSLVGDVADGEDGSPALHLHAVLGLRDGSTRGGHLLSAEVWPTLEVIVTESPAHLRKRMDREVGLPLLTGQ